MAKLPQLAIDAIARYWSSNDRRLSFLHLFPTPFRPTNVLRDTRQRLIDIMALWLGWRPGTQVPSRGRGIRSMDAIFIHAALNETTSIGRYLPYRSRHKIEVTWNLVLMTRHIPPDLIETDWTVRKGGLLTHHCKWYSTVIILSNPVFLRAAPSVTSHHMARLEGGKDAMSCSKSACSSSQCGDTHPSLHMYIRHLLYLFPSSVDLSHVILYIEFG